MQESPTLPRDLRDWSPTGIALKSAALRIDVLIIQFSVRVTYVVVLRIGKFADTVPRCDGLVALHANRIDRGIVIVSDCESDEDGHSVALRAARNLQLGRAYLVCELVFAEATRRIAPRLASIARFRQTHEIQPMAVRFRLTDFRGKTEGR
jgi:hypothetical protein